MIVVDASAVIAMCLDERELLADDLTFESLGEENLIVPAHWHAEVGNALVSNIRRGRLTHEKLAYAIGNLSVLLIITEAAPVGSTVGTVVSSAMQSGLTYYDELYVGLAESKNVALFTFDKQMRTAARQRGVKILPP